ncbi:MAG: hypothetical protein WCL60_10645 [Methylococcales bacterium]
MRTNARQVARTATLTGIQSWLGIILQPLSQITKLLAHYVALARAPEPALAYNHKPLPIFPTLLAQPAPSLALSAPL